MRIPIAMCHGLSPNDPKMPFTAEHFERLVGIVADMGFESINYDQLAQWKEGPGKLPPRPIMFDFDHPQRSIGHEIKEKGLST